MGLGGAVIGGIIGGLFGGGWGAVIGAVEGWLDGVGATCEKPFDSASAHTAYDDSEVDSWETLFRAFGKISKADGIVSREEADLVGAFLHQTGLPSAGRKRLIAAFNSGKNSNRSFSALLRAVANSFRGEAYPEIMTALGDIVKADGKADERELAMLREAEAILGQWGFVDNWRKSNFREYGRKNEGHRSGSDPESHRGADIGWAYRRLGLSPQCSDDDVKKAWRSKAKEFHPDILRGKGVEDSVIRLAEEQMRRVNDAYEHIRKARGF